MLEQDSNRATARASAGADHPMAQCRQSKMDGILFWWFNMYSSADIALTPRPIGNKVGLPLY